MSANKRDPELHAPPEKKRKKVAGKAPTGVHCIAPGCRQYYYKCPSKHFQRVPKDKPQLLGQWLQRMKLKDPPKQEYARVCSDHFTDDDYQTTGTVTGTGEIVYQDQQAENQCCA